MVKKSISYSLAKKYADEYLWRIKFKVQDLYDDEEEFGLWFKEQFEYWANQYKLAGGKRDVYRLIKG